MAAFIFLPLLGLCWYLLDEQHTKAAMDLYVQAETWIRCNVLGAPAPAPPSEPAAPTTSTASSSGNSSRDRKDRRRNKA
jgi:hypothetical protein